MRGNMHVRCGEGENLEIISKSYLFPFLMQSEFNVNLLKDVYFQDANGADAPVEDGALVSIGELRDHDLYTGMKDLNARNGQAFNDAMPIYGFVDYVGVSHADVMGVNYRIGDKVAGVFPVAGEGTRVRMLALGDEFYLGDENFASTPVVGEFAVPTAGSTQMTPASAAAASGLCLAIEDTRDLIMGQVNEGSILYRCRVISL